MGAITLTPSPVDTPVSIPSVTIYQEGAWRYITPGVTYATAEVPTPALTFGDLTISPSPVTCPASVPASSIANSLALYPTPIDVAVSCPSITVLIGAGEFYILATPVQASAVVPAPALDFGIITLTPDPTAASVTAPDVAVTLTMTFTPSAVVALAVMPDISIVVTGECVLLPDPVHALAIVPTPTLTLPGLHGIDLIGSVGNTLVLTGSRANTIAIEGSV
jgi:hypothetical protein